MTHAADRPAIAFAGHRRIAAGPLAEVAAATRRTLDTATDPVLLFDLRSAELIDLDWRGSPEAVVQRLLPPTGAGGAETCGESEDAPDASPAAPRGRGRPRLGVVAREVTLLPRHWAWLSEQPGGASVALRKLVDEARRTHAGRDAARQSRDAAYRFMSAIASSLPRFEEASRQLFAGAPARLAEEVSDWPADVRAHLLALAEPWFASDVVARDADHAV